MTAVMAPELLTAKAPLLMLRVLPCKAPVAVTVAPVTVAVVLILFPVEIAPKPEAMEPLARAPVLVMLPWTAVGRVWVNPGTLLPLVAKILLAAAAVAWIAEVPLP